MKKNPGHLPPEAKGKRVHVLLFNGMHSKDKSPQGWAADDRGGCRWSIHNPPSDFDIRGYEVI